MNIFTAAIVKFNLNLLKSHGVKIVKSQLYHDQGLWEIEFTDKAVLSIYAESVTTTCTCGKFSENKHCKHAKLAIKLYKTLDAKSFFDKNTVNYEEIDKECLICFRNFGKLTKMVSCGTCGQMVHKTCWKLWEMTKNDKVPLAKLIKGREHDQCIYCNAPFKDGIARDNAGIHV